MGEARGDFDGVEGYEVVGVEEGEGVSSVVDSDHADWKRHIGGEVLSFVQVCNQSSQLCLKENLGRLVSVFDVDVSC